MSEDSSSKPLKNISAIVSGTTLHVSRLNPIYAHIDSNYFFSINPSDFSSGGDSIA